MSITTKKLTPKLWADLENLFGPNGACGGCWCMYWRTEKGESWDKLKGNIAKKRFKNLVMAGKVHGVLAYDGKKPIGWCSFDRRPDYLKLNRSPSLKCEDAEHVWSIPCFFVSKDYRNQGIAQSLLSHALKAIKELDGECVEGYPVKSVESKQIPAAFAWTGTLSLFLKSGFKVVTKKNTGKQRVRISL